MSGSPRWMLWLCRVSFLALFLSLPVYFPLAVAAQDSKGKIKDVPESVEDLKTLQKQVKAVVEKTTPMIVGVRIGGIQGSGVIVSKEGHVLTAGHVSGQPGRDAQVIFPDGKTVKAKTLGANNDVDSGMLQITEKNDKGWDHLPIGKSEDLKKGQWVIAIGHPGGFRPGRTPPVRLGRIQALLETPLAIVTDCTLVGGDSGGPLFDLDGKVVGIHSRIGESTAANVHVPVETYRETWDRLAKGEIWGGRTAYLGVRGDPKDKECRITSVDAGSPAEKAGLKADDVVVRINNRKIATFEDLRSQIQGRKAGEEVTLEVQRGEESLKIKVKLGKPS